MILGNSCNGAGALSRRGEVVVKVAMNVAVWACHLLKWGCLGKSEQGETGWGRFWWPTFSSATVIMVSYIHYWIPPVPVSGPSRSVKSPVSGFGPGNSFIRQKKDTAREDVLCNSMGIDIVGLARCSAAERVRLLMWSMHTTRAQG